MHTVISADNPHGYDRYGFAWENIAEGTRGHLDFGCHDGAFLSTLKGKNIARLVGVDISEEAVKKGTELFPQLEITKIREAAGLPFEDGAFDSITALDVLEHVHEQAELLRELTRVLEDGGKLVVTVPGRHLFSFLDLGNFKFRFPRLHRWYYCRGHSRREYEARYVSNPDGLIGDISARKRWHEHFSRAKLRTTLAEAGLRVIEFDGSGFFGRVIIFVNILVLRKFKRLEPFIRKIYALDKKFFESANLFCLAEKRAVT